MRKKVVKLEIMACAQKQSFRKRRGETPHKVGMHYVEENRERAFALNLPILCLGFSCALPF